MGQTWGPFLLGSDTTLDPSGHCAEGLEVTVRRWGRAPETKPVMGSVAAGSDAWPGAHCGQDNCSTAPEALLLESQLLGSGELPVGQRAPDPRCHSELSRLWGSRCSDLSGSSEATEHLCLPTPPQGRCSLLHRGSPVLGGLWALQGEDSEVFVTPRAHIYPVTALPQALNSPSTSRLTQAHSPEPKADVREAKHPVCPGYFF